MPMKGRVHYDLRERSRGPKHFELNKEEKDRSIKQGKEGSEQKQHKVVSESVSLFFLISSMQRRTKDSTVDHGLTAPGKGRDEE